MSPVKEGANAPWRVRTRRARRRRLLSTRVSAFLEHLKEAFPKGTPDELAAYVGA
jgi:hypothetical protein